MNLYKKIVLSIVSAVALTTGTQMIMTAPALAASCANVQTSIIDCGSYDDNAKDGGAWALLLTITNFLSAGVGMVIVASIIVGGITMSTAHGNPDQFAKGRSRILNSLIGLVVFIFGAAFLQYIIPGGMLDANKNLNQTQVATKPVASATPAATPTSDWSTPQQTSDSSDSSSKSDTFSAGQVLIIGDSITERPVKNENYGNEGWWQYLLAGHKDTFKFSAVGGTGFIARSQTGQLPTFGMRLGDVDKYKPRAIIIAGGVNDRPYSQSQLQSAIGSYFTKLNALIGKYNIPKDNVYVFTPRPKGTTQAVISVIRDNTSRIGVTFVDVDAYTSTYDGLHPDSRGAKTIADSFKSKSDFEQKLK